MGIGKFIIEFNLFLIFTSVFLISLAECPFQFRFAILVAGFKSNSSQHDDIYTKQITIPTLHVFGDTDQVISKGECQME